MGIAEEYAKYMNQLRNAEIAEQQQKQMLYAQQQANSLYGHSQLAQAQRMSGMAAALGQGYGPQEPEKEFNPNDHEAWTMAMSTLINLWRSKYLDEWVIFRVGKAEPFWQQAYSRLAEAGKFERSPGHYIRLREDA